MKDIEQTRLYTRLKSMQLDLIVLYMNVTLHSAEVVPQHLHPVAK